VIYRITNWDRDFENAASRKLKRLDWVAVPTKMDGEGYTALVDHPNGAAHFGAWVAIIEIAAKQTPRENRGTLPSGIPQGIGGICRSLGRISRLPAQVFQEVIPRLVEIGWLEALQTEALGNSADEVAESADEVAENPTTLAKSGVTGQDITVQGTTVQNTTVHTNGTARKIPSTAASSRFEEFWELYPRKYGRAGVEREWMMYVSTDNEGAIFACLESYCKSADVARGAIMNPGSTNGKMGWLAQCAEDGWTSRWPARAKTMSEIIEEA